MSHNAYYYVPANWKSEVVVIADEDETDNLSEALANTGTPTNIIEDKPNGVDSLEDRVIDLSTLEVCSISHNSTYFFLNSAYFQEGFEPLLRILLRMGVKHVQLNLAYQVEWLKTYGFSSKQGRFVFRVLSTLSLNNVGLNFQYLS